MVAALYRKMFRKDNPGKEDQAVSNSNNEAAPKEEEEPSEEAVSAAKKIIWYEADIKRFEDRLESEGDKMKNKDKKSLNKSIKYRNDQIETLRETVRVCTGENDALMEKAYQEATRLYLKERQAMEERAKAKEVAK